jgi:hypothetical protein
MTTEVYFSSKVKHAETWSTPCYQDGCEDHGVDRRRLAR